MRIGIKDNLAVFGAAIVCGALLAFWLLGAARTEVVPRLPEQMEYSTVTIDLTGAWKEGTLRRGPAWSALHGAEDGTGGGIEDGSEIGPDSGRQHAAGGDGAGLEGFADSWPQFRGPQRDNQARQANLLQQWPADGPQELWRLDVGEGHAGVAVERGLVYLIDYDVETRQDVIRCLLLADGSEVWAYSYPVMIKWNYGRTRTVPTVSGGNLVAIGPLGHVHCLDALTGELKWRTSLIEEYGAVVPSWYMGQCVLVDEGRVILAAGGDRLLLALSLEDGRLLWQAGPPASAAGVDWLMTHSSVMPMEFDGLRQYVYASTAGVVSVAADDGRLLWSYDGWRVQIATVPSPLDVGENRILLTAGYDAGMVLLKVEREGDGFAVRELARVGASRFSAEQQTPVFHNGHVYAISMVTGNPMVCLTVEGEIRWSSGREIDFERGPLLIVNDVLYGLTGKTGELVMMRASPQGFELLGRHRVLTGTDAWAPMAVADGRLLLRDSKQLVCLRIAAPAEGEE